VGALSGFEYVGILAGEAHSPARNIGRSVLIASPVIALMFILGTSSVLAFIGNNPIDLIGPVPQTLRLGLQSFGAAATIASFGIPLAGATAVRSGARTWLRLAAMCGFVVCLLAIFFTVYPIIDVPSPLVFAAKIIAVTMAANAIGAAIFALGERKRRAAISG